MNDRSNGNKDLDNAFEASLDDDDKVILDFKNEDKKEPNNKCKVKSRSSSENSYPNVIKSKRTDELYKNMNSVISESQEQIQNLEDINKNEEKNKAKTHGSKPSNAA